MIKVQICVTTCGCISRKILEDTFFKCLTLMYGYGAIKVSSEPFHS